MDAHYERILLNSKLGNELNEQCSANYSLVALNFNNPFIIYYLSPHFHGIKLVYFTGSETCLSMRRSFANKSPSCQSEKPHTKFANSFASLKMTEIITNISKKKVSSRF
jgi:hypothetical protein